MQRSRRLMLYALLAINVTTSAVAAETVTYVRYHEDGEDRVGILEDGVILEQSGDLFSDMQATGKTAALDDVRLLPPAEASKVFAVGMNFASHIASPDDAPPPLF